MTNIRVEGYYSFKQYGSDKVEKDLSLKIKEENENLIVNSGLDALGSSNNLFLSCSVGTSNTPVVPTQTSLINQIASTTRKQGNVQTGSVVGVGESYTYIRQTFRYNQGEATGNLNEVGIYSQGFFLSRALIVDPLGNPTTLTVLADEWLDVTYELRFYINHSELNFNFELEGINRVVKLKPALINDNPSSPYATNNIFTSGNYGSVHEGVVGDITGKPSSGTSTGIGSNMITLSPYVVGTYERDVILSAGLNDLNLNLGIKSMLLTLSKNSWQMSIEPPIMKDSFRTLSLTFTFKWGVKT